MAGLMRGGTLCEQVPALGEISATGSGAVRLIPIGFDHPPLLLTSGVNRVGRDRKLNDLVVVSDQVSRRHCDFLVKPDGIWIQDHGSSNGTFINKERVTNAPAKPGDEIGISPYILFRLVIDEELEAPEQVEMAFDDDGTIQENPPTGPVPTFEGETAHPAQNTSPQIHGPSSAATAMPATILPQTSSGKLKEAALEQLPAKPKQPARPALRTRASVEIEPPEDTVAEPGDTQSLVKQLERQRNVLAVLYQISLRCLMASDHKEIEQLLTNVLKRLVQLESGFLVYRRSGSFRAAIVPGIGRPSQDMMRVLSKHGLSLDEPQVLTDEQKLRSMGLEGCLLMIPMQLDGATVGLISCISSKPAAYAADDVDIVSQLANVATAALIRRE